MPSSRPAIGERGLEQQQQQRTYIFFFLCLSSPNMYYTHTVKSASQLLNRPYIPTGKKKRKKPQAQASLKILSLLLQHRDQSFSPFFFFFFQSDWMRITKQHPPSLNIIISLPCDAHTLAFHVRTSSLTYLRSGDWTALQPTISAPSSHII